MRFVFSREIYQVLFGLMSIIVWTNISVAPTLHSSMSGDGRRWAQNKIRLVYLSCLTKKLVGVRRIAFGNETYGKKLGAS